LGNLLGNLWAEITQKYIVLTNILCFFEKIKTPETLINTALFKDFGDPIKKARDGTRTRLSSRHNLSKYGLSFFVLGSFWVRVF
jgi:hypothetical protein